MTAALLGRVAMSIVAGTTLASKPVPAFATDWSWFYDDPATHLSYGFDPSTMIFKDQRVRLWLKIYKTGDSDEISLDRVYQELNCSTNRVRILSIEPRLESEDEDSLTITPFPGDALIPDHSAEAMLRRAVCGFTRPETSRAQTGRAENRKGTARPGRRFRPETPPSPSGAGPGTMSDSNGSGGADR